MRSKPVKRAWEIKWLGCLHAKGGVGPSRDNGQAAPADWEGREKGKGRGMGVLLGGRA